MDSATDSPLVFQTRKHYVDFRIESETCRIKAPETRGDEDDDDFYKGELKWLPDDALVQSRDKQQYSEVQDSDILENDWLNLYAEIRVFSAGKLNSLTKLKFVVQTREDVKSKEKLKAGNAIFYISFMDCGQTEDHRAVVRRTTNGLPGHVCIDVKCAH